MIYIVFGNDMPLAAYHTEGVALRVTNELRAHEAERPQSGRRSIFYRFEEVPLQPTEVRPIA